MTSLVTIKQTRAERIATVIFTALTCFVFGSIIIWMIHFCRKYYSSRRSLYKRIEIKMRRPSTMFAAYLLMLPWVFEEAYSAIILYFDDVDRSSTKGQMLWTSANGSVPIVFDHSTDLKLHFGFWFCFWCFLHIKLFRLWMIRYDFEYDKEMRNIEWKVNLGLRSIKPTSVIIRYRSILGSTMLILCLQLMMIMINTFLQIFVRLLPILQNMPYTQYYEHSIILSILIIELCMMIIIMHKEPMRAINDVHHVRAEWIVFVKTSMFLLSIYLICLTVWVIIDIEYIYVRCASLTLLCAMMFSFAYIDYVWIIGRIRNAGPCNMRRWLRIMKNDTALVDILECQDGFEAMMRFLVGEYCCQNLLCYVECSQFVSRWRPPQEDDTNEKEVYLPLIWGYSRLNVTDCNCALYIPDDVTLLILSYYKKLYVDIRECMAKQFLFFEHLVFDDDTAHYKYLMAKYISDTATIKVNLSETLKKEMLERLADADTEYYVEFINCAREELWESIADSFERFKMTRDYWVLAKQIGPKPESYPIYKDLEYSIHCGPIPRITECEGDVGDGHVALEMTTI